MSRRKRLLWQSWAVGMLESIRVKVDGADAEINALQAKINSGTCTWTGKALPFSKGF